MAGRRRLGQRTVPATGQRGAKPSRQFGAPRAAGRALLPLRQRQGGIHVGQLLAAAVTRIGVQQAPVTARARQYQAAAPGSQRGVRPEAHHDHRARGGRGGRRLGRGESQQRRGDVLHQGQPQLPQSVRAARLPDRVAGHRGLRPIGHQALQRGA